MLPTQHIQATASAVCAAFRFDAVVHDRSVFFLPVRCLSERLRISRKGLV